MNRSWLVSVCALVLIALPTLVQASGCPKGGAACIERSWGHRDLCLDACLTTFDSLYNPGADDPDRWEDCSKACIERRRRWVTCCETSADCGDTCEF